MDGDQFIRTISNLYRGVFERAVPRLNQVISTFFTISEAEPVMTETSGYFNPVPFRYYAPLTVTAGTGITYNAGGTTASRIEYGKGIIATAQGWFAARFRPSWNASDGVLHYVFAAQVDATHRIILTKTAANNWVLESHDGATNNTVSVAATHVSGNDVTLICKWVAGNIYISLNGAAFTSAARGSNPSFASLVSVDFGSLAAANAITATVWWMMMGESTLVDADATLMHAYGNTAPVYGSNLSYAQAYSWLVDWLWPAVNGEHDVLSNKVGENSFA